MKAKEMIERLQEIVDKHGDLGVYIDTEYNLEHVEKIAFAKIEFGTVHAEQIRICGEDA